MKKFELIVVVGFTVVFAWGCNLSSVSPQPAHGATVNPTGTSTAAATETIPPTATATAFAGSTPGPTPTLVSAAGCPPFAFDSFAADYPVITDPALYRGKHYNPVDFQPVADRDAGELLDDDHALEELSNGNRYLELLSRLVCHNPEGKAYWVVNDALIFDLTTGQSIARTCWDEVTPEHPALAIGHVDSAQPMGTYQGMDGWEYDRLDYAYLIDLEREIFTPISTVGMVCVQPMMG
jgi:hypothetical protein